MIEKVLLYHQYYHYYHYCTMVVRLNMTLIPPRRLYVCLCAYMSSSLCLFLCLFAFVAFVCITNIKRKKKKKERKHRHVSWSLGCFQTICDTALNKNPVACERSE